MAAAVAPPRAAPGAATVAGLEPAPVFAYFAQLAQIPRPSRREHRVLDWLKGFAEERRLRLAQDAKGNTVIYKPGQAGGESAPTVILQGHVDMVCEKNSSSPHDFECDPIQLVLDSGWLKAKDTTLGADNGIGVATVLAILDLPADVPHPPLEALFTTEEEIGLIGASALDASMLSGKVLLNLDSEDHGVIYIGCAGAGESAITLTAATEPLGAAGGEMVAQTLSVTGLAGGHSGLQISQGLANAVQLMAGAVLEVLAAAPGTKLVELRGGDKRNAIPREASADLLIPRGQLAAAQAASAAQAAAAKGVHASVEPELEVVLAPIAAAAAPQRTVAASDAQKLLGMLCALPHGPVRMSPAMAGLVETSNNVASVKPEGDTSSAAAYAIIVTTRSSLPAAIAEQRRRIAAVAALAGASVSQPPDYAGWAPNPASPLLALTKKVLAAHCGSEPEVTAIHAGLECGVLGAVLGGDVDMVSFGPTILGAHSPAERLEVATVKPFWDATLALLAELAQR